MEIIFFDIESTGVSITQDHIVSLSAIKTDWNLNILEKKNILVKPPKLIPQEATDVHHITNEMVQDCPPFAKYAEGIYKYFSNCQALGGFNHRRYDIPLLIEELGRFGFKYNPPSIILDSYKVYAEKEPRNLSAAYKFYTGEDMEGAHDAENDNVATIEILKGQMFHYNMSLDDVAELCKIDTLDFDGKLILKDGVPCYNFGKNKNTPVLQDRKYAEWMINGDFSTHTKNILKSILYK